MEHVFLEISVVLIVSTLCATIAKFLRQPMIPAYIFAGILLGPSVLNVMRNGELMEILSTFGIAFLLFLVGIELDLRHFLKVGKTAIVVGCIQMISASGIGYVIIRAIGFDPASSFFLAIALAFSSTIVVLKLLDERKELDTLYGQIVIGILLTQDFIAILLLIFVNIFTHPAEGSIIPVITFTIVKAIALFGIAVISSRFILKHIFAYFARTPELLFLGSICWCLIYALLAVGLGFSIEIGALLAGISLSFLPYSIEIGYRIKSLRDFFLPIFFAVLGGQLLFHNGFDVFVPTVTTSALVLIVSPIVVIVVLLALGYRSRVSFQAGMALGQVSEFSFILLSLAASAGLIAHDIVSLVALIGLITMTLSTYMMEYSDWLYSIFRPLLKKIQRKKSITQWDQVPTELSHHVVLFGHHMMGHKAREFVEQLDKQVIVIDHNPDVIQKLYKRGIAHIYGSMTDEEVLERAHVHTADYLISTVRTPRDNIALLRYVKKNKIKAHTIVNAMHVSDAIEYYKHGATFVLLPTSMSMDYLQAVMNDHIKQKRAAHLKELKQLSSIEFTT